MRRGDHATEGKFRTGILITMPEFTDTAAEREGAPVNPLFLKKKKRKGVSMSSIRGDIGTGT